MSALARQCHRGAFNIDTTDARGLIIPFPFSTFLLFASGLVGGSIAYVIGMPMPFLIGGVFGSSVFVLNYERLQRSVSKPHPFIRLCAIAVIGTMIGSRFTPDILQLLPQFWPSALAIVPLTLLAHTGGYAILRFIGKYNSVDAYFASMPGGLIEAIILGEKAGADVRVLTAQHFVRVISIVVVIPLIFFIATGRVVGSAGGVSVDDVSTGVISAVTGKQQLTDIALILLVSLLGVLFGKQLKLPASHLLGPLCLAMLISVSGLASFTVPSWLLHLAQYVVGVALGAQFSGINSQVLRQAVTLGLLIICYMLTVGYVMALLLAPLVPANTATLFITFAAGGLPEMSLIALSLNASPIIVALHHLIRIFLTIWMGNKIYHSFIKSE